MRDDIEKVICERPRLGGHYVRKKSHRRRLNRIDGETEPKGESMHRRRLYGWQAKEFSDFLEPLKGFLAKSVGRPWSKVYAEMAALLPRDTTTGRHVWQHVRSYVEEHAVFENGRAYNPRGSGGYRLSGGGKVLPKLRELGAGELYVSAHGLLLRYRKKKSDSRSIYVTACQLVSPRRGYVKLGVKWYYVDFQIAYDHPFGVIHDPDVCGVHRIRSLEVYGRTKGDPLMHDGSLASVSWFRRAISKRLMSKADVRQYVLAP